MSERRLADEAARERIATELERSLVVEAAAGTGKTTMLVRRMVAVLAAGRAEIDEVVAVTFTDAAAGELKLRLRAALEGARTEAPSDVGERLTRALAKLEDARIGTIHSFCADLLRERPIEARVDPMFEVGPDDVARALLARVVQRWFEAQLANPHEAVSRLIRRSTQAAEAPREALQHAAWSLCEQRDFDAPWERPPSFDRSGAIDGLMDEMRALGAFAAAGDENDYLTVSLEKLRRFASDVERRESVAGRDYDGLEARLVGAARERHFAWRGWTRDKPGFPRGELRARRDALKQRLDDFARATGAELAFGLREALEPLLAEYAIAKTRAGVLDFLDLLTKTRDLLKDDAPTRAALQRRFSRIFVDEFQDTDPLQAELLLLLAADDPAERDWRRVHIAPGKLFVVGDPKQSIYRFRRADVALYEEVKRIVAASGGETVALSASFRAVPELQSFVNAAFEPVMTGANETQARYVPLSPVRAEHPLQPSIVALSVPKPYGKGDVASFAIEESVPLAVAAFIDWLVHRSGWTIESDGGRSVPIAPQHVCLLFRRLQSRFSDVAPRYLRALESRGLPHVLVGASSLQDREEVRALCTALQAIERPDDELNTFATLRGPLFALSDAALLTFKDRYGQIHAYRGGHRAEDRAAMPASVAEVSDALAVLRELHGARNHRTFAETVARLLAATRAHAGFAVWPTGEQALANVARLLELARRGERRGLASFRAFAQAVADTADGSATDAPAFESDAPGVRLMTVHKAKGLEFPVVVLADITQRVAPAEPSRYTDGSRRLCAIKLCGAAPRDLLEHARDEIEREREEAARVLYVAATRARDLLVVPAVADKRIEGWTAELYRALYPAHESARTPLLRDVPGVPPLGEDATLERPERVRRPEGSVAPGVHVAEAGGAHEVLWFDPHALGLDSEPKVGVRQQALLEADEGNVRSAEGERLHEAWQAERTRLRARSSEPSLQVTTATERARAAPESDTQEPSLDPTSAKVRVEQVGVERSRPSGPRFGKLVHALLASVDLNDPQGAPALALVFQRVLGATDAERDAALEAVRGALEHPLLQGAAQASRVGRCRREVPVTMWNDGVVVEGVVDAAFFDETRGAWVVVDFKTDRELTQREAEYRRQVALYALAIERATGAPTEGYLLKV